MKKNRKTILLIVGIMALILIFVIISLLIKNSKKLNSIEIYNSNIDIQKYVSVSNTESDLTTYNIDLYGAVKDIGKIDDLLNLGDYNIALEYKIKDYNIKLNLIDSPYEDVIAFDLYINNTKINSDAYKYAWVQYLIMYTLGDNIINETHFHTDIASSFEIISKDNDGININSIHELDKTKGMIFENISVSSDGISVNGTRIYHCAVNYDKPFTIYNGSEYSKDVLELSGDIIVNAKYLYEYGNNTININPKISEEVTLKELLDNNSEKVIDNSGIPCK